MKLKTSVLSGLMALALLFSLGFAKEASAHRNDRSANIGFSYDVLMADGALPDKPGCYLYGPSGRLIGTLTTEESAGGNILTFTTKDGTLVVREHADDSISLPTEDGTMALSAGEIADVLRATGSFRGVTSVMHRCFYEIDAAGNPTKCVNCLYAFIWE
ncbi:MAG TPA: hypothetical protein VFX30_12185 [bacterium]|nr:hypothetical protein [bacterium]